jgi:hypothetical protein
VILALGILQQRVARYRVQRVVLEARHRLTPQTRCPILTQSGEFGEGL